MTKMRVPRLPAGSLGTLLLTLLVLCSIAPPVRPAPATRARPPADSGVGVVRAREMRQAAPVALVGPIDATPGPVARGGEFRLSIAAERAGVPNDADVFWPYDKAPPKGVPGGTGVSCDLLVWLPRVPTDAAAPSYTRPACWEHPFGPAPAQDRRKAGAPTYNYRWSGRFSPLVAGTHYARLRFVDANGTRYTETVAFLATASTHPGPIRVSPTDRRFFEFENGVTLPARAGIHINGGLSKSIRTQLGLPDDSRFPSSFPAGLFPLQRDFWASEHQEKAWCGFQGNGGQKDWNNWSNRPEVSGTVEDVGGGQMGLSIVYGVNDGIPVSISPHIQDYSLETGYKNFQEYEVRATVRVMPGFVPAVKDGSAYGAKIEVVAVGGTQTNACTTTAAQAASGQWVEISGRFTLTPPDPNETRTSLQVLGFQNTEAGELRWRKASLKRVLPDGTLGPELYVMPEPDVRRFYDQLTSDSCDRTLAYATSRGEYLRPIIFAHLDPMWNKTQEDGSIGPANYNNVYGPGDPTIITPVRWYQRAAIRYFLARWGWSPHIWGVEFVNEGDPFNGNLYGGAEHFARYVHQVSEAAGRRLLAATSFWHSQPAFWHDTSCDVTDVHCYAGHLTDSTSFSLMEGPARLIQDDLEPARGLVVELERGVQTNLNFKQIPITPGHEYRIRYWFRAIGLALDPNDRSYGAGPQISVSFYSGHSGQQIDAPFQSFEGIAFLNANVPSDTAWTERATESGVVPANARYLRLAIEMKGTLVTGRVRFDDVRLENVTTGETIPILNGNYDYTRYYRDDIALFFEAAWKEYAGGGGLVPRVFDKPWMLGEYSLGPFESNAPAAVTDEQAKDAYRKMQWAQAFSPGQPYALLWYMDGIVRHGAIGTFEAIRSFLSPFVAGPGRLSSGEWKDARPTCVVSGSAGKLRAIGQSNPARRTGILWVDNGDDILGNAVAGVSVAPVSGTVFLPVSNGTYRVQRFDTTTGQAQGAAQEIAAKDGKLALLVADLATDTAFVWSRGTVPLPPPLPPVVTVWTTPGSKVYHSTRTAPHVGSKATAIPLSQVGKRAPCKVCVWPKPAPPRLSTPAPTPVPAPMPPPPSGGITLSKDMTGAQIQQQLGRLQRGELPMGSPPTTTVARPHGLAGRTEAENIAAQIEILNVEIRDYTGPENNRRWKKVWATFRNKGPRPVAEIWGTEAWEAVPGGFDPTYNNLACHFTADERLPAGAPHDPNGAPAPIAPGQTITKDLTILFGDHQGNFPTWARVKVNRAYEHGTSQ